MSCTAKAGLVLVSSGSWVVTHIIFIQKDFLHVDFLHVLATDAKGERLRFVLNITKVIRNSFAQGS